MSVRTDPSHATYKEADTLMAILAKLCHNVNMFIPNHLPPDHMKPLQNEMDRVIKSAYQDGLREGLDFGMKGLENIRKDLNAKS